MRLKLIACEIFYREISYLVKDAKPAITIDFLPKGLHDVGHEKMFQEIQRVVQESDCAEKYDYILLGYGLCNNGVRGIKTANIPLVIPRAHDCIAILMGSKERYKSYFAAHPGTYFLSPGWIEHSEIDGSTSIQSQIGMNQSYDYFLKLYGEDNAQFLYEQLSQNTRHYSRLAYIKNDINLDFEQEARQKAADESWEFNIITGNLGLLERFINGIWSEEEFMIIKPGEEIYPSYDDEIFTKR